MIQKDTRFLNNEGLLIHSLHHWKILEGYYLRDIQKILIMYTKTVMIFCQCYLSWEQMFMVALTMNGIGKRAHVLKYLHRRCVVGAFDKNSHEGHILTDPRAVICFYSTNKYLFTLHIMVQKFMTNI